MAEGTLLDKEVDTTDTPPDEHQHYFSKKELDANLFDGTPMKAMCGFIKEGLAHPNMSHLPICKKCQAVYDSLPDT